MLRIKATDFNALEKRLGGFPRRLRILWHLVVGEAAGPEWLNAILNQPIPGAMDPPVVWPDHRGHAATIAVFTLTHVTEAEGDVSAKVRLVQGLLGFSIRQATRDAARRSR